MKELSRSLPLPRLDGSVTEGPRLPAQVSCPPPFPPPSPLLSHQGDALRPGRTAAQGEVLLQLLLTQQRSALPLPRCGPLVAWELSHSAKGETSWWEQGSLHPLCWESCGKVPERCRKEVRDEHETREASSVTGASAALHEPLPHLHGAASDRWLPLTSHW